MIGPCPFLCANKTSLGYCKTTGCTNSKYYNLIYGTNDYTKDCVNFFVDEDENDEVEENI